MRFVFKAEANLSTQFSITPSTWGKTRLIVRDVWNEHELDLVKRKKIKILIWYLIGLTSKCIFIQQSFNTFTSFFVVVVVRVLNQIYVQHLHLKLCRQQFSHTGLSSMFCIQWFKPLKWKKSWPYRPPVSDDDEGITAVEATGGESVQLQRVQFALVLTF